MLMMPAAYPQLERFKMNTSGPNPWFWAQNDRFGPDVVSFGVNPSQKNQVKMIQNNTKLPHLAQTQVLGPKS